MSKKICILRGSPRKGGNTNALAETIAARLIERGCEVTVLDLYEMDLKPCLACRECQRDWTSVTCVQRDDMHRVFDAVMESGLILLATPIYAWYCTPPMKCALDRMVYAMNMYYGENLSRAEDTCPKEQDLMPHAKGFAHVDRPGPRAENLKAAPSETAHGHFAMQEHSKKGPSLWKGRSVALLTTCGYRVEKGADLFEEGVRRYCKHSALRYAGMLCERHLGYQTTFMDEEKRERARAFADKLIDEE